MYKACFLKIQYAMNYKIEEFQGNKEQKVGFKSADFTRTKSTLRKPKEKQHHSRSRISTFKECLCGYSLTQNKNNNNYNDNNSS